MAAHIARWRTNGIDVVMLQRPPVNAMDLALLEELKELFAALADDSSARAVVLTGQGSTFCAGFDMKVVPQYGKAEQLRLLEVLNETILAVYCCSLPVVGPSTGTRSQAARCWLFAATGGSLPLVLLNLR
jgi:enoyl-CoA hydratase/carnithine racemase